MTDQIQELIVAVLGLFSLLCLFCAVVAGLIWLCAVVTARRLRSSHKTRRKFWTRANFAHRWVQWN